MRPKPTLVRAHMLDTHRFGVDSGAPGQLVEEFLDGGEVMVACGEQHGGDRRAGRSADQVQVPAVELLLLGGAVAAVGAPAHLAATPRAHAPTDRQRQAIEHEVAGSA